MIFNRYPQKQEAKTKITDDLVRMPGVIAEFTMYDSGSVTNLNDLQPMRIESLDGELNQALLQVISVADGHDLFGVVAVRLEHQEGLILVKIGINSETSTLINRIVLNQQLSIGRTSLQDIGVSVSQLMSREHFTLTLSNNGDIVIQDFKSTNGTAVFMKPKANKLNQRLFIKSIPSQPTKPITDPLAKLNWTVSVPQVAEYLDRTTC